MTAVARLLAIVEETQAGRLLTVYMLLREARGSCSCKTTSAKLDAAIAELEAYGQTLNRAAGGK